MREKAASLVIKSERRVLSFYSICAASVASALLLIVTGNGRDALQPESELLVGNIAQQQNPCSKVDLEEGDEVLASQVVAVYMKIKHGR